MSQCDRRPVPRLDLTPKLKRPLSLWNPLDYLRLLYWVLFFPQALRWYAEKFGGGWIHPDEMTFKKGGELLRQSGSQRQFLLQGFAFTIFIHLATRAIFPGIAFSPDWYIATLSVALGIAALSVTRGVAPSVALNVVCSVALHTAWALGASAVAGLWLAVLLPVFFESYIGWIIEGGLKDDIALGLVAGLLLGMMMGVMFIVIGGLGGGLKGSSVTLLGMTWEAKHGLRGIALGMANGILSGVLLIAYYCGLWSLIVLRPDNWILGLPLTFVKPRKRQWLLPHVTPLPLPPLTAQLVNWLRQDWETGIYNANQLLTYTLQFIPVIRAVNLVLAEMPPDLIVSRIAQLAEAPYDWRLTRFASASLSEAIKSKPVEDVLPLLPAHWQQKLPENWQTETRCDTPARAAAAGFWHLHKGELSRAAQAFTLVHSLPYGEEMLTLVLTLIAFYRSEKITDIDNPQMPAPPLLRPTTWKAIARLRRGVEDIWVVEHSVSRSARSFALNRALGELTDLLDEAEALPEAERWIIVSMARTRREALLQIAGEMGTISITEPVCNPYVVGDPVEDNLFVGREDVLSQLEELWVMGQQLQSVVLYGHRRMGKTSILKNAANCLGASIKVVYVNLLSLGNISQGVGEMLMAISDEIARTVNIPAPDDAELLNLPYRTFERYLKQVDAQLGEKGLIIALDEFEQIEEFIAGGQIHQDFIKFLRGLVQMSSKVAFVFAGLHTLEEMTEDYFHPFFASIIPIHVGFFTPESTRQLLANPTEEFSLDYSPEALDQIYTLTAGQPYLIQLVGFRLVRRYNNQVFEQRRARDPVFTVEDVEAVINDSEFFKRGRYYFTGVWSQAAQGAEGQQAILKAIAPHPEGLSIDALAQATRMEEETLYKALETLKRHDVIEQTDERWRIIVELFRRWVLDS